MSGEDQQAAMKADEIRSYLETRDFSSLEELENYLHRKWCEVKGMRAVLVTDLGVCTGERAAT